MSALFIDDSEIDDLYLVSVRPPESLLLRIVTRQKYAYVKSKI